MAILTNYSGAAGPSSRAPEAVYSFGVVPQFETRHLAATWKPILDEINKTSGITLVLSGTTKIPAFERRFMRGEFDFAYMNPYHVLKANKSQGYIPLVRDGALPLRGILVVRKDSPYRVLADLNGAVIAFPAPNALAASLLMRADLLSLHHLVFTPEFVQTHSSVYLHVVQGLVAAGGGVDRSLSQQPEEVRNQLQILYTTREMMPHPVVAHPRVPVEHRELVRQAFLSLATTDTGRAMLGRIPMPAPVTAELSDYAAVDQWGLEKLYEDGASE